MILDPLKKALLDSYNQYEGIQHPVPFEYTYRDKLYYFGTAHTNNPNSPVLQRMKHAFYEFKADIVLVEGFTQIHSKQFLEQFSKKICAVDERAAAGKGENIYASYLALKSGCRLYCPEPDLCEEFEFILQYKPDKDLVFLYYMCRYLNEWYHRRTTISEEEYCKKGVDYLRQNIKWDYDFSLIHLKEIHRNVLNVDLMELPPAVYGLLTDPVPRSSNRAFQHTNLQFISQLSNIYRDSSVIGFIQKHAFEACRLFVVFGATHAYIQQAALIKRLDQRKF